MVRPNSRNKVLCNLYVDERIDKKFTGDIRSQLSSATNCGTIESMFVNGFYALFSNFATAPSFPGFAKIQTKSKIHTKCNSGG
jgi:hypothetical protein